MSQVHWLQIFHDASYQSVEQIMWRRIANLALFTRVFPVGRRGEGQRTYANSDYFLDFSLFMHYSHYTKSQYIQLAPDQSSQRKKRGKIETTPKDLLSVVRSTE